MIISNALNLPAPLVAAITNDDYDNGGADISVTTLLKPPRMVVLEEQHREEIVEDAAERIWSLTGRIGHGILAAGAKADLVEYRLFTEVNGWKVSGQVDILHGHTISDYKFVTVWSVKDGPREEWVQQLNCYHLLAVRNGITGINCLEVCAVLRDWSKLEAKRDRNYPQSGVRMLQLPLWPFGVTEAFMEGRVKMHQDARVALPECTPKEIWQREHAWAVMKNGVKRARALFKTERGATAYLNDIPSPMRDKYRIDFRPGSRTRCESYCAVAPFCQQYQQTLQSEVAA